MDRAVIRYATTDPLFYDRPRASTSSPATAFLVDESKDWAGWLGGTEHPWTYWHPAGLHLPTQGWKVHVSTTAVQARDVLRAVSGFCHTHRLSFKHQTGPIELAESNGKEADRGSAGKFVTIYPENEDRLHQTLTGLDALIGGRPGPYILSDLRWHNGPVFTRYGAFARAWTRGPGGERIAALHDPHGQLVEDRRTAGFTPPVWAPIPAFLGPELAKLSDSTPPDDFGYQITGVLHYSNAGGVYDAMDRDGTRVVLKEGRPYAGLTPDGRDAAQRIADEETRLRALAGPGVVSVRDSFALHGHRFLVLDHVDGIALNSEIVRRNPAIHDTSTPADYSAYRDWALDVAGRLSQVVDGLHVAGYVHGDLHLRNVIVRPDGSVVLLDFEMARAARDHTSSVIGAPGFVPPDRRGGIAADRYALACIKVSLFVPLTPLLALDPAKAGDLLEHIHSTFGVDRGWLDVIRADLAGSTTCVDAPSGKGAITDRAFDAWDMTTPDGVAAAQTRIAVAVRSCADPSRTDRLWPGDPRQFAESAYSLAHGAAGVIHAVDLSGQDVAPRELDWLDAVVEPDLAREGSSLGLFDGLAGVGWFYRRKGNHVQADRVKERILATDLTTLGTDLYGGLSGLGLYLLSEADRDGRLLDQAKAISDHLRDQHYRASHETQRHGVNGQTSPAGLMWGASGTALFALQLYQRTRSHDDLQLAIEMLETDLARCTVASDGSLQVDEGWRLDPYLASGSAGIGLVAAQILSHVPDPERYESSLQRITQAASAPFTIEPGLFYGRAGLIHYLATLARLRLNTPATDAALARHVDQLKLHALRHDGGIGFPGHGLLRMSCDLATGSAGILAALSSYRMLAFGGGPTRSNDLIPLLTTPTQSGIDKRMPATLPLGGR